MEGFYIYFRPLDLHGRIIGENGTSYNMQTVLNAGSVSGFTITGLQKYTRYEFFLIPFFKTIHGRPSNSRITRTMEGSK